MSSGFIITKLVLTGPSVKPAILVLRKGLNVITGPTDTGKSFIYECLDYMMGASKLSRVVNEAKAYDLIALEILTGDQSYTLERSMKGGDFKLYESAYDNRVNTTSQVLSAKHSNTTEKSLSKFLLSLNKLSQKEVRKNETGEKRTISYRDIAHLLLVSENNIIKKESPLLTGLVTNKTAEANVVKFLVTGVDDSSIIAKENKQTITSRKGKVEILNELIEEIEVEYSSSISQISEEIEALQQQTLKAKQTQKDLIKAFSIKNEERKTLSSEILKNENSLSQIIETLSRSQLLREHYKTDISRLESTLEAGIALLQNALSDTPCPYCSNQMSLIPSDIMVTKVTESCEKEIEKVSNLILELDKADESFLNDKKILENEIASQHEKLITLQSQINENIADKIEQQVAQMEIINESKINLFEKRYKLLTAKNLSEKVSAITNISDEPSSKNLYDKLTSATMQPICDLVKQILDDCNYGNKETVIFSEDNMDLVIGNQDRNLSGKGLRAITYAVLIIALTEYTKNKNYSISVPVFDSPLVTYSKPKADGEGISKDLAMDFYRYCANKSTCEQMIILENEEPPQDILNNINHIAFSGIEGDVNRGFIPNA